MSIPANVQFPGAGRDARAKLGIKSPWRRASYGPRRGRAPRLRSPARRVLRTRTTASTDTNFDREEIPMTLSFSRASAAWMAVLALALAPGLLPTAAAQGTQT